jgi:hypothetical protein
MAGAPAAITGVFTRDPKAISLAAVAGGSAAFVERLLFRKKLADELGIPVGLLGKPIK